MLKKVFLVSLLMLVLSFFACKERPTIPDMPIYAEIYEGIYERAYPKTGYISTQLPTVDIWPTERGGLVFDATQIADNKFEFKTGKVLKPNYPKGRAYELKISDLEVWIEERTTVARDVYLNGKLLEAIFTRGDQEIAKFRIDQNNVVYDAFD